MKRISRIQRKRLVSDINVVPYIDVMLVLLVVFMVTAPLLTEGIYVDLPEAGGEEVSNTQEKERLVVSIDNKGDVYISANGSQSQQVDNKTLRRQVIQQLRKNSRTEVYVKGDKSVLYEKVVQVMSLLQESGVPNIGLITQATDER